MSDKKLSQFLCLLQQVDGGSQNESSISYTFLQHLPMKFPVDPCCLRERERVRESEREKERDPPTE